MPFEAYTQDSFSTYDGINVGVSATSVSISVAKLLKKYDWKRALIDYDKEEGLVRIRKAGAAEGYKVAWGQLQARIGRVMPTGRYELIKSGPKEFLFKKCL